jgi:NAD(P)-dependent dehydrogenase (short-subunit alcohol dehydrogenase family)
MSFRISRALRLASAFLVVFLLVGPLPGSAQQEGELRAVLVTGTSTGIGARMVELLSQNGFFVYAGARDAEDLARLDALANVDGIRLDVTIQSEIDAAVEYVRAEGRGLYGLVNNAGVSVIGPMIELAEEDFAFLMDVNLFGPYRVTKAFADLLIESEGRVMTTTSIAGIVTGPMSGAYSMSKHGVEAYTDALAAEFEAFGIEVAAVEPGNYRSQIVASMVERMERNGYAPPPDTRFGSMLDVLSGPRDRSQYEEPHDVARAALHFLTSDSPKRRYMVVPNRFEAQLTIQQMMNELAQLNEGQPHSFSRDELLGMLDQALEAHPAGQGETVSGEAAAPPAAMGLHEAAMAGDVETVRRLIDGGADLNVREPAGGSSPLITATTFGRTAVVRALIEAGADLDLRNNDGSTALMTGAFFARTPIVAALLEAGADPSIRNNSGSTPLDLVSMPFESLRPFYDSVGAALAPLGLVLDYDRIQAARPGIAELLGGR